MAQDAGRIVRPPGEPDPVGLMSTSRSHRSLPLRRHSSIRIPVEEPQDDPPLLLFVALRKMSRAYWNAAGRAESPNTAARSAASVGLQARPQKIAPHVQRLEQRPEIVEHAIAETACDAARSAGREYTPAQSRE